MILEEMLARTWTSRIVDQLAQRGIPLDACYNEVESDDPPILRYRDPTDLSLGLYFSVAHGSPFHGFTDDLLSIDTRDSSITIHFDTGKSGPDLCRVKTELETDETSPVATQLTTHFEKYACGQSYPTEEVVAHALDFFVAHFDVEGAQKLVAGMQHKQPNTPRKRYTPPEPSALIPATFKLWTPVFIAEVERRRLGAGLYSKIVNNATRIGIGDGSLDLNFEIDVGSDRYDRSMQSGDSFDITETMVVSAGRAEPDVPHVFITFTNNAIELTQIVNLDAFFPGRDFFAEYTSGQSYPSPGKHLEHILNYFLPKIDLARAQEMATQIADEESQKHFTETPMSKPVFEKDLHRRLSGIEQSMHHLLSIAQGRHEGPRNVLESDGAYLTRLYTDTINRDRDALRFFDYKGQRIPYVLVETADLHGHAGRFMGNLYFVARDAAPEDWQQACIAVHEHLHAKQGNHYGVRKQEKEIARAFGKEKEYSGWVRRVMVACNGD